MLAVITMIIKKIGGEILKIKRSSGLISINCLLLAFFLLMFFQKAFNSGSGYYTPELLTTQYMSSFNLLMLSLIGFIPAAVLGAYITGIEYKYNTNVYTIVNVGRAQSVFTKIITLLLGLFSIVVFVVFLSILEAFFVNKQKAFFVDWEILISQIFCCYLILLCTAMIGVLGATLTKKIYGGILIGIMLPLLIERIAIYVPFANHFTLNEYYSSVIMHSFKNPGK